MFLSIQLYSCNLRSLSLYNIFRSTLLCTEEMKILFRSGNIFPDGKFSFPGDLVSPQKSPSVRLDFFIWPEFDVTKITFFRWGGGGRNWGQERIDLGFVTSAQDSKFRFRPQIVMAKWAPKFHRLLLLQLDKQTCSHLVVEVCNQRGVSTAPLEALCLIPCKWPVDSPTDLFVKF